MDGESGTPPSLNSNGPDSHMGSLTDPTTDNPAPSDAAGSDSVESEDSGTSGDSIEPSELDGVDDYDDESHNPSVTELEVLPPDVHAQRWAAYTADIAARLGNVIPVTTNGKTVHWTVVKAVEVDTEEERGDLFPAPGLKDGLPCRGSDVTSEIDLAALYLALRPGDLEADVSAINAVGLRKNRHFKAVTPHELVVWEGLLIGASQYHLKGKDLFRPRPRRGLREAPNFSQWMKHHRFEEIRGLVKYAKADLDKVATDPWAMFRRHVEEFNTNRRELINRGLWATLDEIMSSFRPRKDKLGGLPNISFIYRKPKPIGTEFKAVCDASTGVMTFLEIQEGRDAMRVKEKAKDIGVTAACTHRLAMGATKPGATVAGDSWFGSVKVRPCPPCIRHTHID